jgi:hypothetical protein
MVNILTFQDINGRLKLEDLADLIQEIKGTIRVKGHRQETLMSQIMRHTGIDCDC